MNNMNRNDCDTDDAPGEEDGTRNKDCFIHKRCQVKDIPWREVMFRSKEA